MSKANASTSDRQQQTTQTAASEQVFTFWQAAAIVPSTLLGVGVLTLPRELALATDSNSFLPMLVSGAFFLFVVWMITKLGQRFSGLTIVGYTQKLLTFAGNQRIGRVLAFPVLAVVGIWWLLFVAAALRIFGEAQRSVVFPDTPLWFMVGTMLFVSALVAANRAEVIARLNEFLLPIIVIPLVLIVILALDNAEWTNLLPLVEMSWGEFWRGVLQSFFAYQGVSVIAVFMASYQQPEKAVRSHFTGIGIMIVVYLMVTMTTMAAFPHQEVERLMWPTLELVKLTQIPGLILERLESGFLAIWVVAVFTTLANLLTAAVHLFSEYFGIKQEQRVWIMLPLALLVFVVALWPQDVYQAFQFAKKVQMAGFVLAIAIPPLLLILAWLRRMGRDREKESR